MTKGSCPDRPSSKRSYSSMAETTQGWFLEVDENDLSPVSKLFRSLPTCYNYNSMATLEGKHC